MIELTKKDFRVHFDKAVELFNEKKFSEALSEINTSLDLDHASGKAYYYKGMILDELQLYGAAESAFAYASMYDPDSATIYDQRRQKSAELAAPTKDFSMTYTGGHSAFPSGMIVQVRLNEDDLGIPELNLNLPYSKVSKISSVEKEETNTSSIAIGIVAFILLLIILGLVGLVIGILLVILLLSQKDKSTEMVLEYTDEVGLVQSMHFVLADKSLHQLIYKRIIEKKGQADKRAQS